MQPRSTPQTAEAGINIEELLQMVLGITARRASYKDLTEQLNQFLLPHGINIKCCDIFEETLLKEAGVTTQPTKCVFKPASQDTIEFEFQGITNDDLLTFASYYDKQAGDRYFIKLSFDKTTNTSSITMDLDIVYNKFLPAFKEAFSNIAQEKLDHYSDLSEKDEDVIDYNLLQSILTLLSTTLQMTDNKLKAGMLIILHAQLSDRIKEYRKHQLHNCPEKSPSEVALYQELDNFMEKSSAFKSLQHDANIDVVKRLIIEYVAFQTAKKLKPILLDIAATANDIASSELSSEDSSTYTGSLDDVSSALESSSESSLSSSGSTSEASSSRGNSPLRSVARLFATPPSTPSLSRSGSTASLPDSNTSTELYSSSDFDFDSDVDTRDVFADEPDFVPLRSVRFR